MSKKRCDDCNIKTESIRTFKSGFYCFNCYQKHITQIPKEGMNMIFDEPLSISINVFLRFTPTQSELLSKRLHYLFGDGTKYKRVNQYVRTLILADLNIK